MVFNRFNIWQIKNKSKLRLRIRAKMTKYSQMYMETPKDLCKLCRISLVMPLNLLIKMEILRYRSECLKFRRFKVINKSNNKDKPLRKAWAQVETKS